MAEDEFRVELEAFEGPLDLLLYLVQKEEVDVHDIPVARILERYLEVLRASPIVDLDRAGDFLVMASTLMAVKAALLLPAGEVEAENLIDPREELVRQLVEYRRARQSGDALARLREDASRRWPRGHAPLPEPEDDPEPQGVRECTLFDVFAAFHRLLRETENAAPRRILYDDVPQEDHIRRIDGVLGKGDDGAGLMELLGDRFDRPYVLGTFLAVLEMIKEQRVVAVQTGADGEIRIFKRESDAGRAVMEAMRRRVLEEEANVPQAPPKKRPPWKKDRETAEETKGEAADDAADAAGDAAAGDAS